MIETSIDHIYRETSTWETSIEWWQSLGFTIAEDWGSETHRGARLSMGHAVVVLAEITTDAQPADSVVFNTDELATLSNRTGRTIVAGHWGTSVVSVEDPDGRTYTFETRNEDG